MQMGAEKEAEERAGQRELAGGRRGGVEERIKKIEEETTGCIGSIQDALLQITRNDKSANDKLYQAEHRLKK